MTDKLPAIEDKDITKLYPEEVAPFKLQLRKLLRNAYEWQSVYDASFKNPHFAEQYKAMLHGLKRTLISCKQADALDQYQVAFFLGEDNAQEEIQAILNHYTAEASPGMNKYMKRLAGRYRTDIDTLPVPVLRAPDDSYDGKNHLYAIFLPQLDRGVIAAEILRDERRQHGNARF